MVTEDDLTPVAHVRGAAAEPVRGDWPGLQVNVEPSGAPGHALRWESLPTDHDRPRGRWPIGGSDLSIVTWKGGTLSVSHSPG
ncbi:hypothetical protein GCM10025331_19400 [Actinoplanes utahensis]|uniref:Uncharacterized protein n=1 Tax=Actinoplanes utahensis TaxID=1869 RepID=A0A0A6UKL2_ACTUT|nr:hypothetical protein MB27_26140 [Actinoplanes utahensis]GIF30812.1 hypothetical protein Aut01nite_37980 [Actinoplanes utahensis]